MMPHCDVSYLGNPLLSDKQMLIFFFKFQVYVNFHKQMNVQTYMEHIIVGFFQELQF